MGVAGVEWPVDIWGSSPNDVFAVGYNGTIVHYNGSNWSSMESGSTESITAVWGISSDSVYALTFDTILHYQEGAWSTFYASTDFVRDIWGTSDNDLFVVGDDGAILHFNGTSWSNMVSHTTKDIWGVWGISSSDVFAICQEVNWGGTSFYSVLHYDGTSWNEMTCESGFVLGSIWGSSENDVFAGGWGGELLYYDGVAWTQMSSITSNGLNGIWGSSGNDVFAVGSRGTIIHYTAPPSPCPECAVHPVDLQNVRFEEGTNCQCSDSASITIGSGVTVESGAKVIFKAPKITVKSGAQFKKGSDVTMKQE